MVLQCMQAAQSFFGRLFFGGGNMLDEEYMREALRLARNAAGRTSPNPLVGAVIVRDGRIVAEGWHRRAGTPHAEVLALQMAGELAKGATLYVTLEPCVHHGRTGPCVEAIIGAGIRRVVAAIEDPNPLVKGQGFQQLREAGIEVTSGVLEAEARQLNEAFHKWISTRTPFVTLKMAMTLDGKIATAVGESQWITGEAARQRGHEMRDLSDAILVGIETVLADDPSLTTRLPEGGRNPVRIVLDSQARMPLTARMLGDGAAPVLVAVTEWAPEERLEKLRAAGAEIVFCGDGTRVDLSILLKRLGEREICSLLVEGGGIVHFSFLQANLADKVCTFIAPQLIGGAKAPSVVSGEGFAHLNDGVRLRDVTAEFVGEDICLTGYVRK